MAKTAFFIDLEGWPCLVAGGCPEALDRTRILLDQGAWVAVWAQDFAEGFSNLANRSNRLSIVRANLTPEMLEHLLKSHQPPRLVVLATGSGQRDHDLYMVCEALQVLASRVGRNSRLNFGHTIDREALTFGISSETAPELADLVTHRLERELGPDWSEASSGYAAVRQSEAMQKLHPELRAPQLHELAAAILDSDGNFKAAKLRAERKLGKEF